MSKRKGETHEEWKERHRDRMRAHRAARPEVARQIAASHRKRNAEKIKTQKDAQRARYEALKAGPCVDCDRTFPPSAWTGTT